MRRKEEARNSPLQPSRRDFLRYLWEGGKAAVGATIASQLGILPTSAQSNEMSQGEVVASPELESRPTPYAYIATLPDKLYLQPSTEGDYLENQLLYQNTGPNDRLSDRYTMMVGDMFRVRVEGDWAEIQPDAGSPDPFTGKMDRHVYIPVENLRMLETKDFAPIQAEQERSSNRLIVVIHDDSPRVVVFDGTNIVMHSPVFLGRGDADSSMTPRGDFRVYYTRASDNMPSFTGVPYVSYFTGDKAFHEFHGWNWPHRTRGGYGSRGCVNLPDDRWFTAEVNGERISPAAWLYRWISSVPELDYDESDPEIESVMIESTARGWYDTTTSIRTLVVSSIWDLYNHPVPTRLDPEAAYSSWNEHIEAYQEVQESWVLTHDDRGHQVQERINRQLLPET